MITIVEFDTEIWAEDGDTKIEVGVSAEVEGDFHPYKKKMTDIRDIDLISVYRYDTESYIDINSLDIDTRENLEIEATYNV